jgi:hypothetical protein
VHQPRALPDLHSVPNMVRTNCYAMVRGNAVIGEFVLFRLLDVVSPVEKVKAIGSHGRILMWRGINPDNPGNTESGFGIGCS